MSAPALADILGLSARRVQQLGSEGILSKDGEGYPLSGAIQEYCEYLRGGARSNQDELDVETLRLTRAKADKAEIAVELLVGTTASMDAVEQVVGGHGDGISVADVRRPRKNGSSFGGKKRSRRDPISFDGGNKTWPYGTLIVRSDKNRW